MKGVRRRFVWAMGTLRTPRKVLSQAAAQSPACFSVFQYGVANSIPDVTQGKSNPYHWRTSRRGNRSKASHVSQYPDLPAGTYVFTGHDETTGTETSHCPMSIRGMTRPASGHGRGRAPLGGGDIKK